MTSKQGSRKIKFVLSVILFLASLFSLMPAYAEKWKTTKFKIIQEHPEESNLRDEAITLMTDIQFKVLDKNLLDQLENYLKEVALDYEKMGFKSPKLPIRDSRYIVHTFNYSDEHGAGQYSQATNHFWLDRSRITSTKLGVQIDPKTFEHLAHELFHAVQASYPLFAENKDLGDWIYEATAEAMGIEMSKKYAQVDPTLLSRWGVRGYYQELRVASDTKLRSNTAYWTSSFWRYIGEYISNRGNVGSKEKEGNPPDYSYLNTLFNQNIAGQTNEGKELDWLDQGLRKKNVTGVGLNKIYSRFVTTFAHYVPDRFGDNPYAWRRCLFTAAKCKNEDLNLTQAEEICKSVTLQRGTAEKFEFGFPIVGATCFEVKINGYEDVSFPLTEIRIYSEEAKQLDSLWIGTKDTSGKATVFKSLKGTAPKHQRESGKDFVSWVFTMSTNPQIFVVNNIADKPSKTKSQFAKFIVSYPQNKVDLVAPPDN